jgi:Zn-dependent protease
MESLTFIQKLAISILPIIFAITVHEAAHGWMARRLGDKTSEMLGRVTLNPLKHIDPIGTILVPLVVFKFTGFMFGWAKPVPVNWNNLDNPKRDMGLVALAGPGANLLMALIWSIMVYVGALAIPYISQFGVPLLLMGVVGVLVNAVLMVLNLMPIPPLDGGRVVYSLLPAKQAQIYSSFESYGLIIVLILLASGVLGGILWPLVGLTIRLLPASDIVSHNLQYFLS